MSHLSQSSSGRSADDGVPVIPLPNPGEGGPVDSGGGVPVIPLPNPGEGGPVDSGGGVPVIPLPNPGEGGPVYPGGQGGGIPTVPVWPAAAQARFLHAAYGYPAFQILIDGIRAVRFLGSGSLTPYRRLRAGYHTVSVAGLDGYIYLQKSIPFDAGSVST